MVALDNSIGAVFIGTIVSAVLYGFTCVQTYYYYTHYPSDHWFLKFIVGSVLVSDSCHLALITHMVYVYLVTNFGNYEELKNVVWSLDIEVFFNAYTTLCVQCFLAVRIYRLSNKNWILTGIAVLVVLGEFFTSLVFTIMSVPLNTFVKFAALNGLSMSINAFSAVGDLVIAVILCYLLHVSRTGFRRSDTVINKLIVFSINTGLLTSLFGFGSLISISVWPHAWIYIAFYFCIGRLYCNTLLATLNARKGLRGASHNDDVSLSCNVNSQSQQKTTQSVFGTTSRPNNISIKIDTTHEYIQDEYGSSGDMKGPEVV